MPKRVRIMDRDEIAEALAAIARHIRERDGGGGPVALVGIRTRGVPLAQRLAAQLERLDGRRPPTGTLDINLYRDDLSLIADHPVLRKTEIPFELDGAGIVLVDDVLYTGRTVRAALDGLVDLGRPAWIRLAVLIDRGHRELPIHADYVGREVATERADQVEVRLEDTDGVEEVLLLRQEAAAKGRRR